MLYNCDRKTDSFNKKNVRGFLIIFAAVFLVSTSSYGKVWKVTKITDNDTHDGGVVVDQGQIAWRGVGDNGKQSILFKELGFGQVINLTADTITGYFGVPRLSNGQVVWRAFNRDSENPRDSIVFWDGTSIQAIDEFPSGAFPSQGYPPSYGSVEPTLHNGQVAYAKWDGNDYEIYLWDGQSIIQITNNDTDDYEPQIHNEQISWTGKISESDSIDVFFWDGSNIQNISNMPEPNEDSHLQDGRVVFYGFDKGEPYKADIFIWDGTESRNLLPVVGYDYEPEIGDSLIAWTGWPYGKPDGVSVCWIWDEYKLFDLMNSAVSCFDPRTDGYTIAFRAHDGQDWEIYIAEYITGTFKPEENDGRTLGLVVDESLVFLANGMGDLIVADVSNPTAPTKLGSLRIADGEESFNICKKDQYVFLASRGSGVQVLDVSSPTNPSLIAEVDTPDKATVMTLDGDYLFVGDRIGGLRIINVIDPASPIEIGALPLTGSTYGTAVKGTYAYVANYWRGMRVVDISMPGEPVEVASYTTAGLKVWDVAIRGDYAYLVCPTYGIKIVDISDPLDPQETASMPLPDGCQQGQFDAPLGMVFLGQYGFVANGTQGLLVLDLANPASPQIVERIDTKGYAWGVQIAGINLYVADGDEGFHVIDVSDYVHTVYEDGEDDLTSGWLVYDNTPEGAVIANEFDTVRQSRVIRFAGAGHENGYRLLKEDGTKWENNESFFIEWSMAYSEFFTIYIDTMTTAGRRVLTYKPLDSDGLGDGTYVYYGLGEVIIDGQWHTVIRDLQSDLSGAQPEVQILAVNGFLVRGSGAVDDIKLHKNLPEGMDRDLDGIPNANEIVYYGTDPMLMDTDLDGVDDGTELNYWFEAWNLDPDGDGKINILDEDADGDGYPDGEELDRGSDPGDPLSVPPVMEPTVYEDAEDGKTLGWEIYDDDPPGAQVLNVFDGVIQSRIIQLDGAGHTNGYVLRGENGDDWGNRSQFTLEWSMAYNEFFTIYIDTMTTAGRRILIYKPLDYDALGEGIYVYYGLSSDVKDGTWRTFARDLQADLEGAQPEVQILEINGFMIRGNGFLDNISLR